MFDNSEEYDFTPSKSSKLASLFGLTATSNETTSDSLIYKPPKQPTSVDSKNQEDTSKSLRAKTNSTVITAKVVNCWKLKEKNYELSGRYGLALIGSTELNLYEVIGYKEKNNIIFRAKVNNNFTFYNQKESFSTFCDNELQQWLVQFENDDQIDFSKQLEILNANINSRNNVSVPVFDLNNELSSTKPEISTKPQQNTEILSDSSGSQKRANILNRMAKMGQSILPSLPVKNITSSEFSDSQSEIDEIKVDKRIHQRKCKHRTNQEKLPKDELLPQEMDNRQILAMQNSPTTNTFNLPTPVLYGQPFGYDSLNNFILAQNTELKINLAQITSKLDNILDKNTSVPSNNQSKAKIKALELKIDNLQMSFDKSEKKYFSLKEKYDDLLKTSKAKSENQELKIKKLEDEILQLKINLGDQNKMLKSMEMMETELEKYKTDIREQENIIKDQSEKLKNIDQFQEKNENVQDLEATIKSLNAKLENFKLKQKDFDNYVKQINSDKKDYTKKTNGYLKTYNDIVKHHMNEMYQSVLDDFDDDIACSYSYNDIQSIIAKQLKGTTFKLIESCKNTFLETSELVD